MVSCKHELEKTKQGFTICIKCAEPGEEKSWGGARKGAGRPVEFVDGYQTIAFQIDPLRLERLEKFMKESGSDNRSAALREIIDKVTAENCFESKALKELEELEDCLEDNEPDAGGSIRG